MALFSRKKEEEIEDPSYAEADESRYASEGEGNFSRRRFKDLHPENKKKRKEPPKPWGKKERISILIILLATVIVSAILAIKASSPARFNLSLPKFDFNSLNIFKEQTIIINKK